MALRPTKYYTRRMNVISCLLDYSKTSICSPVSIRGSDRLLSEHGDVKCKMLIKVSDLRTRVDAGDKQEAAAKKQLAVCNHAAAHLLEGDGMDAAQALQDMKGIGLRGDTLEICERS
ncbi:hypothetical protein FA95DRAFT_1575668 [Auriscalpium vulgare]|uniref:Uncharacterized protein n=1 Tax=Auriscalpium vulgare TaxID=40419 RepID=A0ACB8RG31_9AGAM|nr:hypothetical protein FA95DRAFT_1575668 [Auriscalpium vulgare]